MAGRAREIQVIFRVNEQERLLIRQKMELMGVRNMQAYLRKMAIDGYAVKLDLPELREAVAMLGRYNGNINQIAKRANETGRVYGYRYSGNSSVAEGNLEENRRAADEAGCAGALSRILA